MRPPPRLEAGRSVTEIEGTAGEEFLFGAADADVIDRLGGDDLRGEAGDDRLAGGEDGDLLSGGRGADSLDGGGGDDRLAGGEGRDILSGGSGSDLVYFSAAGGDDRVGDFTPGTDEPIHIAGFARLELSSLDAFRDLAEATTVFAGASAQEADEGTVVRFESTGAATTLEAVALA